MDTINEIKKNLAAARVALRTVTRSADHATEDVLREQVASLEADLRDARTALRTA